MAHEYQRQFCEKVKEEYPNFFKNKKVLDIGSLDINGNNKDLFENCTYIGLDLGEGKNVDVIYLGHLYDAPDNYFDTIISTEAFEHDIHYEKTIGNIIRMLKPGGLFLFTCAAPGRPEHGTRRTGGFDAPLLIQQSEEWSDYYKNLTEEDIRKTLSFNICFSDGHFRLDNHENGDLYFYGIKDGSKYLVDSIIPQFPKEQFNDDIFIIDSWPDNESKENDLVGLIKILKIYNIPILLTGHYPIKPEIQKMVDYYLFDKDNPILTQDQFDEYSVNSGRWTTMGDVHIDNKYKFHHDYAIWITMKNAFNFAKFLGKKNIHFFEYDSLPNPVQYRQAFMEKIGQFDAVLYEYHKDSAVDKHFGAYCATFIFSIKTDIAIQVIDLIKTKKEYYQNRPQGWQLERNFLNHLKKITNNIFISPYIANDNELNTQAVWSRDGVDRNGAKIQLYLVVDSSDNLYLHTISGFHETPADEDYLIEVNYLDYKKFHTVLKDKFDVHKLGKYKMGYTVKVYHQGKEVLSEFLGDTIDDFRKLNLLTRQSDIPDKININFVDGPFVEILGNQDKLYHIQFINKKNNHIEFELDLRTNHWAKCSKKYYVDWLIKIKGVDNDLYMEHLMNLKDQGVLISFESKSLGDTIAWISYAEKFRVDHQCKVICSTFHNNLFVAAYPSIEFIEPGTTVHNIHALYRVGLFHENKREIDYTKHLTDPKKEPLTKIASDILGLEYVEILPKLPVLVTKKKKTVSIAIHGTAQCKYWNNPSGWQEVVNFLLKNGYEVKLLSSEIDGYMGNKNPEGVIKIQNKKIEDILKIIQESELFIGISSGLSWLAWGARTETILISGFTDDYTEPTIGVRRVINKNVCHGCWSNYDFDPGDWNWCPVHKGTDRQFECSKTISPSQVINEIRFALQIV
jgi:autotransporter strand-loop-strand O-heptosyltransferase